jgi:hypothetical protein
VTLLIVRSTLRGGRALAVGLAMAAAVVVIDLAYAIVGLAGVGSLLNGGSLRLWFGLVSAAVLIGIGMRTLWIGWRACRTRICRRRRRSVACLSDGRCRNRAQPVDDRSLAVSFPAAAPAQAIGSTAGAAAVLLGVGLGTLTWYGGFSTAVALTRKRVGDRLLRLVDFGVGSGLIAFGGLLGYRSLHEHA